MTVEVVGDWYRGCSGDVSIVVKAGRAFDHHPHMPHAIALNSCGHACGGWLITGGCCLCRGYAYYHMQCAICARRAS